MPTTNEARVNDEDEMLDWDMFAESIERERKTISVTLRYTGRGKPLDCGCGMSPQTGLRVHND
jgi:hypothetical protein